tara:strand:- start:167 stop:382 length:216 start_codon:yes stop_codon:yes gene_type:complete
MIIKNSSSPKRAKQAKDPEHMKYSYKESFKIENKSLLDDSEFIENHNNSLKSPQSRRLYKTIESEFHTDRI